MNTTATQRRLGWVHPAYGMTRILDDEAKARLEARAPQDPTYTNGWLLVVAVDNGS